MKNDVCTLHKYKFEASVCIEQYFNHAFTAQQNETITSLLQVLPNYLLCVPQKGKNGVYINGSFDTIKGTEGHKPAGWKLNSQLVIFDQLQNFES